MKPDLRIVRPGEYRPFNGKRLQQARELRGLSVKQLAIDLDCLPMEIELYENGGQVPDDEMEFAIARWLDFPEAFFHQEDPPEFGPSTLDWHWPKTKGQK